MFTITKTFTFAHYFLLIYFIFMQEKDCDNRNVLTLYGSERSVAEIK